MGIKPTLLLCCSLLVALTILVNCSLPKPSFGNSTSPSPIGVLRPTTTPQRSLIREIDFSNYTFPSIPSGLFTLRLKDGSVPETRDRSGVIDKMGASLLTTIYGDIINDQKEEAIIVLSLVTGGSSLPNYVYIYSLQNERPILLWSFATGDRADGGLRKISVDKGDLTLEIYRPEGKKGDCCPIIFKRIQYHWINNRFVERGTQDTLPNTEGHGSPITS